MLLLSLSSPCSAVVSCGVQGMVYGCVFFLYGVALWYGSKLVRQVYDDNPQCATDPTLSECFSGGKTMIVRSACLYFTAHT